MFWEPITHYCPWWVSLPAEHSGYYHYQLYQGNMESLYHQLEWPGQVSTLRADWPVSNNSIVPCNNIQKDSVFSNYNRKESFCLLRGGHQNFQSDIVRKNHSLPKLPHQHFCHFQNNELVNRKTPQLASSTIAVKIKLHTFPISKPRV